MIKIEKGIPLPPPTDNRGTKRKWPFLELEVGDSFEARGYRTVAGFNETLKKYGRRCAPKKFAARLIKPEGDSIGHVRVWRTV